MAEWTDDEIRRLACAYTGAPFASNRAFNRMKTALSAVKRVPDGYWIAPDEPTPAMNASGGHAAFVYGQTSLQLQAEHVYRAMRDAYGRK